MSHFHVDGVLTIARLKRTVPGGALYEDIAIRRADCSMVTPGRMRITGPMLGAVVPGARGRFYFHDVAGIRGMHGFRSADGGGLFHFPALLFRVGVGLAVLSLLQIAAWLAIDGSLPPFALLFCVVGSVLAILFGSARLAARRRFDADAGPAARPARPAIA